MSAAERLRRAQDAIESAAREQRDRRELTERRLAETETKARAAFQKEIDSAMRYADHLAELARRKDEAGGWATEKSRAAKDNVMGFSVEDDERAHQDPGLPPGAAPERTESTTAPAPRRGRHSRRDDFDDEDFSNNNWLG
ncbi:MAG TPA: hypothetical protein VL595_22825 [Pseudonocardia sp.]|nr:hypothetical protein [Pseudonocardia sp.]